VEECLCGLGHLPYSRNVRLGTNTMKSTDYIVIAVIFGILVAVIMFDLWVRSKEK
jgi:hypothetical protein